MLLVYIITKTGYVMSEKIDNSVKLHCPLLTYAVMSDHILAIGAAFTPEYKLSSLFGWLCIDHGCSSVLQHIL